MAKPQPKTATRPRSRHRPQAPARFRNCAERNRRCAGFARRCWVWSGFIIGGELGREDHVGPPRGAVAAWRAERDMGLVVVVAGTADGRGSGFAAAVAAVRARLGAQDRGQARTASALGAY